MTEKLPFGHRFSSFSQRTIALIALIIFAFLAVVGFVQTCHVDIGFSEGNDEHVSWNNDNILINLAVFAVLLFLALLLMRAKVKRKTVFWVTAGTILLTAAVGVWWVLSAHATPSADSYVITTGAQEIIRGETQVMLEWSYFHIYPFQLGFLLFAEGFFRIFGVGAITQFQIMNVLFVCINEIAVVLIAKELFDDPRVELLTAILLGLCLQPAFLSTFIYGTIPGMMMATWSIYFVIRAIKKGKFAPLIPAAILIVFAVLIKKNFWIVLIAESAMIFLYVLRSRKHLLWIGVAAMFAGALFLPKTVQTSYENRTGESYGRGTPQMAWLVTGFRDSSMGPGWYNSYTNNVLRENNFDYERTLALCKADFIERAELFASRPIYLGSFFFKKLASQWNEPEFQSIWSSATQPQKDRSAPISEFIDSLGRGEASDAIHSYFNQLMQFVYAGMAVAFFSFFRKKGERDEAKMLFPTVLIGAVFYHMLFEAKSQYAIIYVPLMLPYAAFGVRWIAERILKKPKQEAE